MIFQKILQDIVDQVDGCDAAVLMAGDGIPVADYIKSHDNIDIQIMSVEFSRILKDTTLLVDKIMNENVREFFFSTEKHSVLFCTLQEGYFVALLMQQHANIGKGRFLLKTSRPQLLQEL